LADMAPIAWISRRLAGSNEEPARKRDRRR
jgi:hypothetical protein